MLNDIFIKYFCKQNQRFIKRIFYLFIAYLKFHTIISQTALEKMLCLKIFLQNCLQIYFAVKTINFLLHSAFIAICFNFERKLLILVSKDVGNFYMHYIYLNMFMHKYFHLYLKEKKKSKYSGRKTNIYHILL